MNLFGWEFKRVDKALSPPSSGRWTTIHDPYTGAWQQDSSLELETVLTFSAVFACVRLITSDIGKMRIKLVERKDGIWQEIDSPSFSPVLRKPNGLQTRIKFIEQWMTSKLLHGNAYILKGRDRRGVVTSLRVLDPTRVQVLVSESGEAFYKLSHDRMTVGMQEITLPATEIIHDVHVTPDHPLVGMSPIAASGLTAAQGMNIQESMAAFFKNRALPSGMLSAPGTITKETADRLKENFQQAYGGENIGKIAVAGDGLKFDQFSMSPVDAQLIEQLRWTAEDVCRAFGVPAYKIGVGNMPTFNNMAALDKAYYSDTLQELIECVELLLDEGLELPKSYGTEFDLAQLLRMDALSRFDGYEKAIKAGWQSPNEVRALEDLPPVEGGEEPIMQQQNWPLSVLAKRAPPDTAPPAPNEQPEILEESTRAWLRKELSDVQYAA
jgi:HK97 family phage portal protein